MTNRGTYKGYFDTLKQLMDDEDPAVSRRIEWKTNDGGAIKVQDLIALAWIPLNLITPVKDGNGRAIEPVSPQKIYSSKGSCLKQFEKLMGSPQVTAEAGEDYRRQLENPEVESAFHIAVQLPGLYDYIYQVFPKLYNAAGGSYGRITTVKSINDKRKIKTTPFTEKSVEMLSPDGFIIPLVYGVQELMEKVTAEGKSQIRWKEPPMQFLQKNLGKIVKHYTGIFSMCDYDPQKIGKNPQSYEQARSAFKMALAGIL